MTDMRFFPIKDGFLKRDVVLAAVILVLTASSALVLARMQGGAGSVVRITADRELYGEYSLSENQVITVRQPSGYNRIVIEDGAAYMEAADCPDRYCMDYSPVSKGGETIICLPHRVVVEVVGGSDRQQPDAVAR